MDKHNELRRKVAKGQERGQPAATNMNKLEWSDELAKIAQLWADQCPSVSRGGHDDNRKTSKWRRRVGQNVSWRYRIRAHLDYVTDHL